MNLYQRILEVYKKVKSIKKDSEIAQGNSSYTVVTHDAVTKALHMPLAECGIVCVPTMYSCHVSEFERTKEWQGKVAVTKWYRADVEAVIKFINAEKPDEFFESKAMAYAFDTSDKAIGKAYSMAVKSIYLKTFMLESTDEEEERVLEKHDQLKEKKEPEIKKEIKREVKTVDTKIKNEAPVSAAQLKHLLEKAEMIGLKRDDLKKAISYLFGIDETKSMRVWQFEDLWELVINSKDPITFEVNIAKKFDEGIKK